MLFQKIGIVDENFEYKKDMYVGVKDDKICYIGKEKPDGDFGRVYDGIRKVLIPGLVNAHTHSPMTLLRGYAENLPLERWLNERVFPFEDRLNCDRAYYGTMLSAAEMLSCGTTAYSDMYFFADGVIKAAAQSGMKTNFSRSVTSFSDVDFLKDSRVAEALEAAEKYHNTQNGRIKIDLSLHAEYTNTLSMIEQFGEYTSKKDFITHIHMSETKAEHENCKNKYGKTPARLFYDSKILDSKCLFAHCVWIDDEDIEILKEKNASIVTCPASNLKLGSGVCDSFKLLNSGINLALGTDSASSNNGLDMLREMYLAAILPKGFNNAADIVSPGDVLKMATLNGAVAQGRYDCGLIKENYKADLAVISLDSPNMYPDYNVINNIVYSAEKSDVILTMVDGRVLYENGEFVTVDIEKIGSECNKIVNEIVGELNV